MTVLPDRALYAARNLPPAAQDDIARVILRLAGADDEALVPLTPEKEAAVADAKRAVARGEFATDDEVQAVWSKYDLLRLQCRRSDCLVSLFVMAGLDPAIHADPRAKPGDDGRTLSISSDKYLVR